MPAFSTLLPLMTPAAPSSAGETRDIRPAGEADGFDAALLAATSPEPPPVTTPIAPPQLLSPLPTVVSPPVTPATPDDGQDPSPGRTTISGTGGGAGVVDAGATVSAAADTPTAATPATPDAGTVEAAEEDPTRGAWWKGTAFEDFVLNGNRPVDITASLEEVYAQATARTTRPAGIEALTKAPALPAEDAPETPAAIAQATTPLDATAAKVTEAPAPAASKAEVGTTAAAIEDDPERGAWWKGTAFEDFVRNGLRPVDVSASLEDIHAQATARTTRPAGIEALTKAPPPPTDDVGDLAQAAGPQTAASADASASKPAPAAMAAASHSDPIVATLAGADEGAVFEPIVAFADATTLASASSTLDRDAAPAPHATTATAAGLAAEIARRIENRQTRFELALNPEGLGQVDVSIAIDRNGGLSASLTFDQAHAASELNARSGELREVLEKAGFDLPEGALSFASRDGSDGRRDSRQTTPAPFYAPGLSPLDDAAMLMPTPAQRSASRGRLDVRI